MKSRGAKVVIEGYRFDLRQGPPASLFDDQSGRSRRDWPAGSEVLGLSNTSSSTRLSPADQAGRRGHRQRPAARNRIWSSNRAGVERTYQATRGRIAIGTAPSSARWGQSRHHRQKRAEAALIRAIAASAISSRGPVGYHEIDTEDGSCVNTRNSCSATPQRDDRAPRLGFIGEGACAHDVCGRLPEIAVGQD